MECKKHPRYRGLSKPHSKCKECINLYKFMQVKTENEVLETQLKQFREHDKIEIHPYLNETIRFGVVSDTHLGSYSERIDQLDLAYRLFKREGIVHVYHPGDILDGEKMYRGQEYELHTHGAKRQIDYCVKVFPKVKGITTHFIVGNHDLSFWKHSGIDVGEIIASKRKDLIYEGSEEADIKLKNRHGSVILRLSHPGKGTAYALSYHPQKYIESLTGGEKPNIVLMGHYHKAEYLFYRNVFLIQAGTLQAQTPFMRRQNIAAMGGFWIVELVISGSTIKRCQAEFVPSF